MKKYAIDKVLLGMLVSIFLLLSTTVVFADDEEEPYDGGRIEVTGERLTYPGAFWNVEFGFTGVQMGGGGGEKPTLDKEMPMSCANSNGADAIGEACRRIAGQYGSMYARQCRGVTHTIKFRNGQSRSFQCNTYAAKLCGVFTSECSG